MGTQEYNKNKSREPAFKSNLSPSFKACLFLVHPYSLAERFHSLLSGKNTQINALRCPPLTWQRHWNLCWDGCWTWMQSNSKIFIPSDVRCPFIQGHAATDLILEIWAAVQFLRSPVVHAPPHQPGRPGRNVWWESPICLNEKQAGKAQPLKELETDRRQQADDGHCKAMIILWETAVCVMLSRQLSYPAAVGNLTELCLLLANNWTDDVVVSDVSIELRPLAFNWERSSLMWQSILNIKGPK